MMKFILYLFGIRQGEAELPPSANITRATHNASEVVTYHAEYADGCHTTHFDDGGRNYGGPKHAPHEKFHPEDQPVREWRQEDV